MSFREANPEKTTLESDGFRGVALPVLFFGGLAFAVWNLGSFLWNTAGESAKASGEVLKKMPGTTKTAADILNEAGGVPPSGGNPSAGDGSRPALAPAEDENPEDQGAISIMPEQKAVAAKPVTEWKLRGVTYDLLTLKPLPGVQVIFNDLQTNSRAQVQTDAQGRYRTVLPPLQGRGYTVTMSKSGYSKAYLNPGTEGVSEMPLDRRQEIVKELKAAISDPATLEPNSDTPLVTDFHLAPQ